MDSDVNPRILELNEQLREELKLWEEECRCVPGDVIVFDNFLMDNYLTTLAHLLVEKGILDDEELTIAMKERQLESMRDHRPRVKEMRLKELQARLGAPTMGIPKSRKH